MHTHPSVHRTPHGHLFDAMLVTSIAHGQPGRLRFRLEGGEIVQDLWEDHATAEGFVESVVDAARQVRLIIPVGSMTWVAPLSVASASKLGYVAIRMTLRSDDGRSGEAITYHFDCEQRRDRWLDALQAGMQSQEDAFEDACNILALPLSSFSETLEAVPVE